MALATVTFAGPMGRTPQASKHAISYPVYQVLVMNTNIAASHPPLSDLDNTYVHRLDRQYVFHSWA